MASKNKQLLKYNIKSCNHKYWNMNKYQVKLLLKNKSTKF